MLTSIRQLAVIAIMLAAPLSIHAGQIGELDSRFTPINIEADANHHIQPIIVADNSVYLLDIDSPHSTRTITHYSADGRLDVGFGVGGSVSIPTWNGAAADLSIITQQADKKILLAGHTEIDGIATPVVERYLADGRIDPTFAAAGRFVADFALHSTYTTISHVRLLADGRILIVASIQLLTVPHARLGMIMLNPDGSLCQAFGGGIRIHDGINVYAARTVDLIPANSDTPKILVGAAGLPHQIYRLQADGSLDPSFNGGVVWLDENGAITSNNNTGMPFIGGHTAVQADGKVITAGFACLGNAHEILFNNGAFGACTLATVRHNADGSLDSGFVHGAKNGFWGLAPSDIRIQRDGKILLAISDPVSNFGYLARLNANGTPDQGFVDSGKLPIPNVSALQFFPDGALFATNSGKAVRLLTAGTPPVLPVNGLWTIDSDPWGPGRGIQIEVQRDRLFTAIYGYEADGRASFHIAAGPFTGGTFSGDLLGYRGGPAFGAEASPAIASGTAGRIRLTFSDSRHGTITLPGETPKSISKYNFGTPTDSRVIVTPVTGMWLIDSENTGAAGRGFLLEAQNNVAVIVFDGYTAQGDSSFYLGSGPLQSDGTFDTQFNIYRDGTAFGTSPRLARHIGDAGLGRIWLRDGLSGTIQLPGESLPKEIRKLVFGSI